MEAVQLQSKEQHESINRKRSRRNIRKWIILVLCMFLTMTTIGFAYSLGAIYVEIVQAFDSTRAEAVLVQSMTVGILYGAGIFGGGLISRFGSCSIIIAGAITASAGLLASAFAVNTLMIIICTGIGTGLGSCFAFLGAYATISQVFNKGRNSATISISLGAGLGPFVFPYLLELFIEHLGWRGAFMISSGIILNNIPAGLFIHYSTREAHRLTKSTEKTNLFKTYMALGTDISFIVLATIRFLLCSVAPLGMWFLVDIAVSRGFNRKTGSIFLSVVGISNLFGRLIAIGLRMTLTVQTLAHWIYIALLIGLSHVLFNILFEYWALVCVSILYGLCYGMFMSQCASVILEAVGIEKYAVALGLTCTTEGVATILGGYLGGYTKDITGDYSLIFYTTGGIGVLAAIVHFILVMCNRGQKTKTAHI